LEGWMWHGILIEVGVIFDAHRVDPIRNN